MRQGYNQEWELRLYERDDLVDLFGDAVEEGIMPQAEYDLIQDAHIVELTDIARVLLMHMVGGIYIDLDRLVNIPLDEVVSNESKMVLLSNKDHHFMQDIMISSKGNELYRIVLEKMTDRRLHGGPNNGPLPRKGGWLSRESLFSLGGPIYLETLSQILFGQQHPRQQMSVPAARQVIRKSSRGLIQVGRHDFCNGALMPQSGGE
ncbi:MAG: hypothetical protein SGARI_007751 [Bacillariaceae sp.]